MNKFLHNVKCFAYTYIDDIVVFSSSWEEQYEHNRQVLWRLQEAGLMINAEKCQWGQTEVEFLSHVMCEGVVRLAPGKMQAITEFARPKITKNVWQSSAFLGVIDDLLKVMRTVHFT